MLHLLENFELFKLLKKKECEYKNQYEAILKLLVNPIGELLEYTKANFPNYTDHTIRHSVRVLNYLARIMSSKMKENITATEIFCLILSAMFHDIGMSSPREKDKEKLRKEHGFIAKEVIDEVVKHLQTYINMSRIKNCIIYVCESHMKDLQQLYGETQFRKKDTINGEEVRYGYLAILLRIGDLMDMEEDRTSCMVRTVYPEYYEKDDSLKHHRRCEELDTYNYSNKRIDVIVKTVNKENYKLWSSWFTYLKDEIVQANTYYFREFVNGESLPQFEYKIELAEGASFSTEEIRFEIDDKGALWKIISNSVYTAEFDYIRELVQNAIDGCLMDCYLDASNVLKRAFPREWPLNNYCVTVMHSEEKNKLIIHDNGIGMDAEDLKRYLFKTADSRYKHLDIEREFAFPAIAKFGIGFVACLTKAKNIKLITQENGAEEEISVEIEEDSNLAFIEHMNRTSFHGTMIVLQLKDKYSYTDIKKYLEYYFSEVAVKIEMINLDVLSVASEQKNILKIPQNLDDFNLIIQEKNKIEEELRNNEQRLVNEIISMGDTLRQKMSGIDGDDIFPLNEIMLIHKEIVSKLKQNKFLIDKILFNKLSRYTKKNIDIEHEEYEKLLSDIISNLAGYRNSLEKSIYATSRIFTIISDCRWRHIMEEDVCTIYLDKDLLVEDVKYKLDHKKMKTGRGIIFIKTEYFNCELGIEFEMVNMFFFQSGELVPNLIKTKSNHFRITDEGDNDIVSVDEIRDIDYQLSLIFEDEEDEDRYRRKINQLEDERYSYVVDMLYGDGNIKILRNINSEKINEHVLKEGTDYLSGDIYGKRIILYPIPQINSSMFCQDGIRIDIDISGLIPFNTGFYRCNFFGESRFELNITRHDINRDGVLISNWLQKYGKIIQENLIYNIKNVLEKHNINHTNLKNQIKLKGDSSFEKYAYKQFGNLL